MTRAVVYIYIYKKKTCLVAVFIGISDDYFAISRFQLNQGLSLLTSAVSVNIRTQVADFPTVFDFVFYLTVFYVNISAGYHHLVDHCDCHSLGCDR